VMLVAATALLVLSTTGGGSEPSQPAEAASVSGSTVCDPGRPHDAGDFNESIESSGIDRDYILHVPPSYGGSEPTPLVLNFHGLGSEAAEQAAYSELPAKSDEAGFILVTPDGSETEFFPNRHWNFLLGIPGSPDDILFVSDLLDTLEAELCIDSMRIYSTGISNGAMMSVRLACDLSDRIAAIAPVAGVYYPPWSPNIPIEPKCATSRPMPVIAFHGTGDFIVPFAGGPLGISGLDFDLRHIVDEVMPAWAEHNSCSSVAPPDLITEHVSLGRYELCPTGVDVHLYAIEDGGHLWPGADDLPANDVNDEISATDLIWEFFEGYSLTYLTGDAGCNGRLDSVDATLLLQLDAGLVDGLSCPADPDLDGDGGVDSRDASLILQHVAGLLPDLPG